MPAEETDDVEVNIGSNRRAGNVGNVGTSRGVIHESVDPQTGDVQVLSGKSVLHEDVGEGDPTPRRFKESTLKLLEKLEHPDEEGDGGPDDPDDPDNTAAADAGEGEGSEGSEETTDDGETTDEQPKNTEEINEWQTKAQQYETANQRLVAELDAARKTPARDRTDYEQQLVDAYKAYVDEGPVVAIRKFLGAVLGSAHDSKEVTQELSGAYIDLTAQELNVPLDQSQQAMREAARARLALARDKRERAESEKKAAPSNSAESQQIEQAGRYIDGILNVKGQSGTSYAEEYPLLVALAEDFDGVKPSVLLATAIRHEVKIGALTGQESEDVLIRHAARKIEAHYNGLLEKGSKAKPAKKTTTDATKSGTQQPKSASKETRQSTGARTITNAKASVAPSTPPKTKQQKQPKQEEKPKFKSKREQQDYALRHIPE